MSSATLALVAAAAAFLQPQPQPLASILQSHAAVQFIPSRSGTGSIAAVATNNIAEATSWIRLPTRSLAIFAEENHHHHQQQRKRSVRDGYAITAKYTVPDSIHMATPLPDVLCSVDSERFPSMSRARKSCRRGEALLNGLEGRCITTARAGDVIELQARVNAGYTPRGKAPFDVEVVYEDDALAVVYKPAGVCTHPPPGGAVGGSMRTAIQYTLKPPPAGSVGALYRPHTCHRLDKPTSGLLLCAKTKPALVAIQRGFARRQVHKRYCAIVSGFVEGDEGLVDLPIDDKTAVTKWVVTRRARSLKLGGSHLTELALYPKTGRTHQLRIHCAEALKCPILGDKTYGGEDVGSGLFLSAVELTFVHPSSYAGNEGQEGAEESATAVPADEPLPEPLNVVCASPKKFDALMEREQARWDRLAEASDG